MNAVAATSAAPNIDVQAPPHRRGSFLVGRHELNISIVEGDFWIVSLWEHTDDGIRSLAAKNTSTPPWMVRWNGGSEVAIYIGDTRFYLPQDEARKAAEFLGVEITERTFSEVQS
jgi:hypothetical protein